MVHKTQNNLLYLLSILIVVSLIILNSKNSFFWDTVQLGSKHANYFFTTNFSSILLPNDIDSGHIPTFGVYIAFLWKIFGRNLIIGHLAMLPFAIGIVCQLHKLCSTFIDSKYSGIALLLILIDPTLLSQMTLVSPDIPLVFFFLLGINAILNNRQWIIAFCVFFLFLTSMRGMMISVCLFLLDIYYNVPLKNNIKRTFILLVKRSLLYLPAVLLFISFSSYHYIEKGWIGYHKDSPWADCFAPVDFKGFLLNIAFLGWRILDFGRVGIWIVFFILLINYRKQIIKNKQILLLLSFFVCTTLLLTANMLWAKNLLGHRYLLPLYLIFSLTSATILFSNFVKEKLKYILSFIWLVVLISGNFWIYPPKTATGWDSTLAHLPYYQLRHEAIQYLDTNAIDLNNVTSFFPNTASIDLIDLNGDQRQLANFNENSEYVFFSNIYNVDDKTYNKITKEYLAIKQFSNDGVYITIYKKH
jgi:hypothetical protein